MNILEIDNVELKFGTTEILKAIYFKAEKGKVTGILGSNGSGKTSLLRIVFGELKPHNKLIRFDNKPILTPLYKIGIIKYLPQFHIVPKTLSLKSAFKYFEVSLDDGKFKRQVFLNRPDLGLHIPPGVWASEVNFSSGAICLVLASHQYNEADYLREYEDFLNYINE